MRYKHISCYIFIIRISFNIHNNSYFKIRRYNSVDNRTKTTMHMFFPFIMCEVKCGREGLDIADRQNMHSCSVAVRAILRN